MKAFLQLLVVLSKIVLGGVPRLSYKLSEYNKKKC
jgi:hypothetical protein